MNENIPFQPEPEIENSRLIDAVLVDFQEFTRGVSAQATAAELYSYLCEYGSSLLDHYCQAGETYLTLTEKNAEISDPDHYLTHFSYPDRFKSCFLLVRDVMLQLSIARLRALEDLVSEAKVQNHFEESKTLLHKELDKISHYLLLERKALVDKPEVFRRKLESVKHFSNPWKTFQVQFQTILSQIKEIDLNDSRLRQTIAQYQLIQEIILQMRTDVLKTNSLLEGKATASLVELKTISEKENLSTTIKSFEDLITLGIGLEIRSESALRHLEDSVNKLGLLSVPVDTEGGYLVLRKIDFRKNSEKWLDFEILPYLIDLWDLQEATFSPLLNIATQIKSSLLVAKKTQQISGFDAEISSLASITQQQINTIKQSEDLVHHIEEKLSKSYKVTTLYTSDDYLKVPFQTNFSRLTTTQQGVFSSYWSKFVHLIKSLGQQVKDVKEKTPHKRLELALEILETRNEKEAPDHYHSLFLNKNFIGDLFLVKRKEQEEEIEKIIKYWRKGQNRSLAVVGDPLSGKSTILEYVTHQFKSNEVHHLTPGAEISIEGRKLKVGRNMEEVLNFVKRTVRNSKPVLVLDDLHLWRDSTYSLLSNTKALVEFISSNSSKVFVIIGMTNALRLHLDSNMQFSQGLTNLLHTNLATTDEIYKAVMLRHGASHRAIFEKEGIKMTDAQLQRKINWLTKKFDSNIGAVLQAWIFCTDVQADGSIRFSEKETHLNDFLSITELLLLKNCLLFGYCSDLELKILFSERYETEYKPAVRKLLNIGVLDRDTNGYLIVKNTVRQDLFSILKYRELLA